MHKVAKQQEGLRRLASELRVATPGTSVTEADLAWALQAVRSRAFSGPYAGERLTVFNRWGSTVSTAVGHKQLSCAGCVTHL